MTLEVIRRNKQQSFCRLVSENSVLHRVVGKIPLGLLIENLVLLGRIF